MATMKTLPLSIQQLIPYFFSRNHPHLTWSGSTSHQGDPPHSLRTTALNGWVKSNVTLTKSLGAIKQVIREKKIISDTTAHIKINKGNPFTQKMMLQSFGMSHRFNFIYFLFYYLTI